MRLQKLMAEYGIASRRRSEELIKEGKVFVNGKKITELGYIVDPEKDVIKCENKFYNKKEEKVYYLLNKPVGYICTANDEKDRKKVVDLIKTRERIYPVGRLDYDTSGLLIMTNDGDLTYTLTHPKHEIKKVYVAEVKGIINQSHIDYFNSGIVIEDYKTKPARLEIINIKANVSTVEVEIHEGKNRQIRKMFEKINHEVINLKRVSIGDIKLDNNLKVGEYRKLTESELKYLRGLK